MVFYECIAIILRGNSHTTGGQRPLNRPSGGFMTPAWPRPGGAIEFVAVSWRHSGRDRPLYRRIVANPDVRQCRQRALGISATHAETKMRRTHAAAPFAAIGGARRG